MPTKSDATADCRKEASCAAIAASHLFSSSFNVASTLVFFAGAAAAVEVGFPGAGAAGFSFFLAAGCFAGVAVVFASGVAAGVSSMVVDGFSSDAGDAVSSSWANADVMKLKAAMPINDVTSFI